MAEEKEVVMQKQEKVAEQNTEVKAEQVTEPEVANKPAKKQAVVLSDDVKQTKNIAWLAYILFFIPLLINKNSAYVRHNANEGLEINVFDFIGIVLTILGTCIKTTSTTVHLLLLIFTLVGLGLLVLTTITKIYMIYATLKGKTVETPWMWRLKIIK